jgi:hypothetical protein
MNTSVAINLTAALDAAAIESIAVLQSLLADPQTPPAEKRRIALGLLAAATRRRPKESAASALRPPTTPPAEPSPHGIAAPVSQPPRSSPSSAPPPPSSSAPVSLTAPLAVTLGANLHHAVAPTLSLLLDDSDHASPRRSKKDRRNRRKHGPITHPPIHPLTGLIALPPPS